MSRACGVLRLTRNFGSTAAVLAGMEAASGDAVAAISADLQDPPELLHTMIAHWRQGCEVVLAVRDQREDPFTARLLSDGFYAVYRRLAQCRCRHAGSISSCSARRAAQQVLAAAGPHEYLMGLILWLGYAPVLVPYHRRAREKRHGRSMWTLLRRLKYAMDGFVGFSATPLRLATRAGLLLCVAAAALPAARVHFGWKMSGEGFATIFLVLLALGVQLIATGILGEYLWRLLEEVRRRPRYLVDRRVEGVRKAISNEARIPSNGQGQR